MLPLIAALALLTGLIVDSAGASIANASVEAALPDAAPKWSRVTADETGRFRFISLPPGNYILRVRAIGFATRRTEPISLTDGKPTELPPVVMEVAYTGCCDCEVTPPRFERKPAAQASLQGWIGASRLDDNGRATLTPKSFSGDPIHLHLAGQATFRFSTLKPGRYSLRIEIPTYGPYEIDEIEIEPNTATRIDGAIVPSEYGPTRNKLERTKPNSNALCL